MSETQSGNRRAHPQGMAAPYLEFDIAWELEQLRREAGWQSGQNAKTLVKYDGLSPRIGVMYRLRPNIALGASFWGKGAPPWRDEIWVGVPGEQKKEQYGFTLTLGSRPESGTDLMISSPTGNWSESARLYVRMRATR